MIAAGQISRTNDPAAMLVVSRRQATAKGDDRACKMFARPAPCRLRRLHSARKPLFLRRHRLMSRTTPV